MKESNTLWLTLAQLLLVLALIAIGTLFSARLACLLLGVLAVSQFVMCVNSGKITVIPFFRTIVESQRFPRLFVFAAASHAIVSFGLVVLPLLSWLGIMHVAFLE